MKKGFTLSEVLITLGVIGGVASITLPILTKNYQEKVLVNRLKETYSMISQAHQFAIAEHGDVKNWDLGGTDSPASMLKFSNYYKPYLKIMKDCGINNNGNCFYNKGYKALFNNTYNILQDQKTNQGFSKIRLINGASLAFFTPGKCQETGVCGSIMVDLNGNAPPNKAGVDYFYFNIIKDNAIIPSQPSVKKNCQSWCCEYKNTSDTNGAKCTKWVLEKGNMDYLRRDISNEW